MEQEFDSEPEQIEAFRGTFAAVLPLFQDFVDDLDDLDPPAEVADAHGELVAGFADLMGDLEDLIDQLSEVDQWLSSQNCCSARLRVRFGDRTACSRLPSATEHCG